jgi:hypothetical protein
MNELKKTIFMTREQWEKWDAALRSGEYKQTGGGLNLDGGYCCLGVLQKCLTGEAEQLGTPSPQWLSHENIKFADSNGDTALDGYVVENPYLPSMEESAAGANDDGVSFEAIADAIKEAVQFPDGTYP